jgi:trans-aconitate 2-methyltransferase
MSSHSSAGAPLSAREWNSEAYQRLSSPQFGWGQKVLERVRLRGDETIIDAGCGTGHLTAELLARLPRGRALAVDLSFNMLRTAQRELARRFAGRVRFVVADLQHLPFDQVADGIFSTASFHWIKDHDRLFRSLYRALRPGGWLEAQCGGGPNLARLLERAARLMALPPLQAFFAGWQSPWEYASPEVAAERLRRAGFTQIRTALEFAPAPLPGPEPYEEFLATIVFRRHLERIADADLRRWFLQELTRQAMRDEPPFLLDYCRLNLSARKPVQA